MNKILGFTAGNFDLLHPGYIYTFEEAKNIVMNFMYFYMLILTNIEIININL